MANSINGRVFDERSRRPLPGLTVEALAQRASESLGAVQTNADGAFEVAVDPRRFKALVTNGEGVGFRVTGPNREEYAVSGGGLWSGRAPDAFVSVVVRPSRAEPIPGDGVRSVQGVVTDAAGIAAAGLEVEAWDRSVADKNLLGTATTGTDGRYVVTYDQAALSGKSAADLLVRVVVAGRAGSAVTESDTLFQAPQHAIVDLVVERADLPVAPEYGRLLAHVKPLLGDRHLGDVDAGGVGYLAGRGAWDARGVAMAARAEQLSGQTQIPASHYYALMRAGLPGDPAQIYRLDDTTVSEALQRAVQSGVISADDNIDRTLRLYRAAALESLRTFRPEGRVSSLGDMLSVRLDADRQRIFLDAYRSTNRDPDALWTSLADRGFDERTIKGLQTDAVLGELTRQNAPVVGRLVERTGLGRRRRARRPGLLPRRRRGATSSALTCPRESPSSSTRPGSRRRSRPGSPQGSPPTSFAGTPSRSRPRQRTKSLRSSRSPLRMRRSASLPCAPGRASRG